MADWDNPAVFFSSSLRIQTIFSLEAFFFLGLREPGTAAPGPLEYAMCFFQGFFRFFRASGNSFCTPRQAPSVHPDGSDGATSILGSRAGKYYDSLFFEFFRHYSGAQSVLNKGTFFPNYVRFFFHPASFKPLWCQGTPFFLFFLFLLPCSRLFPGAEGFILPLMGRRIGIILLLPVVFS